MTFEDFTASRTIMEIEYMEFSKEADPEGIWKTTFAGFTDDAVAFEKRCLWTDYVRHVFDVRLVGLTDWNVEQFEAHWVTFDSFWSGLKPGQLFPLHPFENSEYVEKTLEFRCFALEVFFSHRLIDATPGDSL